MVLGGRPCVCRRMDELTLAIAGIDFPNPDKTGSSRRMEILMCHPGDPVDLRPEPRNAFDASAIAVWSERGVQIGYLSAERAPYIGRRMQGEAIVAVFQALQGNAAYVRVRFGGGQPTLPSVAPPAAGSSPAPDADPFYADPFYADPSYPDEDGPEWGA